ncbi:hypothetical protein IGI04_018077 [Brassica rapa subsp. trilocularis]|uniref:Uncharacterized protein n=1 Tax=Brassica rapa subsp. trilocularis TaxID=1813537 RepID=A0ABQ7MBX0_BRACM|nr:hypothetical protein IGI04_018077 [Brassica rapa subsp. trilocularis]
MEIVLDGEAVDSGLFETFFTYLSQRKRFVAKSDFGDRAMTSASERMHVSLRGKRRIKGFMCHDDDQYDQLLIRFGHILHYLRLSDPQLS